MLTPKVKNMLSVTLARQKSIHLQLSDTRFIRNESYLLIYKKPGDLVRSLSFLLDDEWHFVLEQQRLSCRIKAKFTYMIKMLVTLSSLTTFCDYTETL